MGVEMICFTFFRQNKNSNKKPSTVHMLFEVPGMDSWPGYQADGVLLDFKAVMILIHIFFFFRVVNDETKMHLAESSGDFARLFKSTMFCYLHSKVFWSLSWDTGNAAFLWWDTCVKVSVGELWLAVEMVVLL